MSSESETPGKKQQNRLEATRNQILDAATQCYLRRGLLETHLQDIAEEAGVGRTTLYRHFSNHEELMGQLIIRDISELMEELDAIVQRQATLSDKIIESFMFCISEFPHRPVTKLFFTQQTDLLSRLSISASDYTELGAQFCRPVYDAALASQQIRNGVDLAQFVEWNTRILLSLQAIPHRDRNDGIKMRQFLKNFLVPSLLKSASD